MPANSLLGQRKVTRVVNAQASFIYDRACTYAECLNVPGGGTTLQLPDDPSDGDEYEWTNPDDTCGPGNVITLDLSAVAIAAGITIQGATSQAFTSPGTTGKAVYFQIPNTWQLQLYEQGGGTPTGGEGGELVWRGGATPSPGIVATGAQVAAAIAASPVPLTVYVDSSRGACTWLAADGVVACLGTTTFASYNAGLNNGAPADLMTVNDTAVLNRVRAIDPALEVQCQCLTTSALSFDTTSAGLSDVLQIRRGASLVVLAGAAFPAIGFTGELTVVLDENVTLDSVQAGTPVISLGAASLLNLHAYRGVTFTGTAVITGPGGSTVAFVHDDTVPRPGFAGWGFGGTVTETRLSLAAWATPASGATGARPAGVNVAAGQLYFDTTLGALIEWSGTAWVGNQQIPGTGSPAPGTPAYNPTWYALTDIYWDPAAGLDTNAGTVGVPVKTFAEIIRRYGSTTPLLSITQTLHLLSPQGAGDPVVFSPILTGGINFILLGTPTAVGAAFSPAIVRAKNRATPQLLQLGGGGVTAGMTAGTLLLNVTKGSYAFIDNNDLAGTLTMTQPFATAGLTTVTTGQETNPIEDDTWANTDSYQRYALPQCNLKEIAPSCGDTSSTALADPVVWIQQVHVPDISGSIGYSTYNAIAQAGASVVHSMCWFDAIFVARGAPDELNSANMCCWHNGSAAFQSWWCIGGASNTNGAYFLNATYLSNLGAVDGDVIIHGALIVKGTYSICGLAYIAAGGTSTIAGTQLRIEPFFYGTAQLWGPGGLNINGGGALMNESGGTWALCFTLAGAVNLDGVATGTSPEFTGTFTLNGVTQVDVPIGAPLGAAIAWSLKTVGSTPGVGSPYFSAASTAGHFFIKSPTPAANDVYNWTALGVPGVAITAANLDTFGALISSLGTGSRLSQV